MLLLKQRKERLWAYVLPQVTCYDVREIGGELVRWNATRFGTVFIFLQSFLDRKDKFKLWMASADWENCKWAGEEDHEFAYDCLTKNKWWSDMEKVLKAVSPIYPVLRLAYQQKSVSISSFLPKMMSAMAKIRSNLGDDPINKNLCDRLMQVINRRLDYMLNDTLMLAVAALNPEALYTSKMARKPKFQHAVTMAIKKLSSSSSKASAAIDQYTFFRKQARLFGGEEAKDSALNGRASAADWWDQYGGDYPELQEFTRHIVSQCMSSSGCERNWSTFALVHTKLRNRLSYDKLHKLVYVHYNLKLRIQHFETDIESFEQMKNSKDRNIDPCSIMIDVAMYDEGNPIMEWLCSSRSESVPTLDENDEPESPNRPSGFVLEELGGLNEEEMVLLNSRIGSGRKNGRKRNVVEEDIGDDFLSDSSEGGGSPTYNESGDSDSNDGGGDDEDGEPSGPCFAARTQPKLATDQYNGPGQDEQAAPLRPRSKRQKKLSIKGLYMLQK